MYLLELAASFFDDFDIGLIPNTQENESKDSIVVEALKLQIFQLKKKLIELEKSKNSQQKWIGFHLFRFIYVCYTVTKRIMLAVYILEPAKRECFSSYKNLRVVLMKYNLGIELCQLPNFEPKRYNVDDNNKYFIHCINDIKISFLSILLIYLI